MDALLPAAERYASLKFRRIAYMDGVAHLAWDDACELVAFLHMVPPPQAKYIFHWNPNLVPEVKRLLAYDELVADAAQMIEENQRDVDEGDGFAVLKAMQDGGWRGGKVPNIVRMAVCSLVDGGLGYGKVGKLLGLTKQQVRYVVKGPQLASRDVGFLLFTG